MQQNCQEPFQLKAVALFFCRPAAATFVCTIIIIIHDIPQSTVILSDSLKMSPTAGTPTAVFNRIFKSFTHSGNLQALGIKLIKAEKGLCEISLPYSKSVANSQHTFQGGAIGTLADAAGGFASLSVAPEGMEVATVEYKINFLSSHQGGELRAVGKVVKGGKRILVTTADVFHIDEQGNATLCAVCQQTLVPIPQNH